MQFSDFGRESVTSKTCSAGNESFVNDVGGGGIEKDMTDIMLDMYKKQQL